MINRLILTCTSCGTHICTRTAMGHGRVQKHGFCCPGCSVPIRYSVRHDPGPRYEELENATSQNPSAQARFAIAFDPEILSMREGDNGQVAAASFPPYPFSPYMAAVQRCRDILELKRHQTFLAQVRATWAPIERLFVHFQYSNRKLLDAEIAQGAGTPNSAPDDVARLRSVRAVVVDWQAPLLHDHRVDALLYYQRWRSAHNSNPTVWTDYCEQLAQSGRLSQLWRSSAELRSRYAELFSGVGAILQLALWRNPPTDLRDVVIHDKRFEDLRPLYVDAFEHMCRLSAIAMAAEGILDHGTTDVTTNNGSKTIWDFEEMKNANKAAHVAKTPLAGLAVRMDTQLRNGVGHFQTRYDYANDEVICAKTKGPALTTWSIPYAEFCRRLVDLCSVVFELDAYVFYAAETLGGRLL